MRSRTRALTGVSLFLLVLAVAGSAYAWSSAQKVDTINGNSAELNTPSLDGCPIQSPDGLNIYLASNRPGGKGGLDMSRSRCFTRSAIGSRPASVAAAFRSTRAPC